MRIANSRQRSRPFVGKPFKAIWTPLKHLGKYRYFQSTWSGNVLDTFNGHIVLHVIPWIVINTALLIVRPARIDFSPLPSSCPVQPVDVSALTLERDSKVVGLGLC